MSITAGTEWGDTDLTASDSTNPVFRATALNSQDFSLVAGGLDGDPAYLSFAPAVFGRRIEGGVRHNLTNDVIQYSELEVHWDERGSGELTDLHKAGVIAYRLNVEVGSIRFVVSQGISTLQANANSWNTGTDT